MIYITYDKFIHNFYTNFSQFHVLQFTGRKDPRVYQVRPGRMRVPLSTIIRLSGRGPGKPHLVLSEVYLCPGSHSSLCSVVVHDDFDSSNPSASTLGRTERYF